MAAVTIICVSAVPVDGELCCACGAVTVFCVSAGPVSNELCCACPGLSGLRISFSWSDVSSAVLYLPFSFRSLSLIFGTQNFLESFSLLSFRCFIAHSSAHPNRTHPGFLSVHIQVLLSRSPQFPIHYCICCCVPQFTHEGLQRIFL